MGKTFNGMMVGLVLGTAVGMMVLPQLDKKTQRNVKRAGRRLLDAAEDKCDCMMYWMK